MKKNKGYIMIAGAIIFSSLLICAAIISTNIKPPFDHCYYNVYNEALAVGKIKNKTVPIENIKKYAVNEAIFNCSIINGWKLSFLFPACLIQIEKTKKWKNF